MTMDIVDIVTQQIERHGACDRFKGGSIENLVNQLFTPQGIEFVKTHHYPDLHTFRKFGKYDLSQYGIYVDAGNIMLSDKEMVVLVGKCNAKIEFNGTKAYRVYLLYGSKANITSNGYAIVRIEMDETSKVNITKNDNSIILR